MAGKIKAAIDQIIAQQSHGNANMTASLKIKLIRRGIDPDCWHETSPDDPTMCLRVGNAAKEMDITLPDLFVRIRFGTKAYRYPTTHKWRKRSGGFMVS